MQFPRPLSPARLQRRYKRFLADMVFPDGSGVVAHCPNPGAMTGLADPGIRCLIAPALPGAKLGWGWKIAELTSGARVLIDTGFANRIVAEALEARQIPGLIAALGPYSEIRPEARADADSRIDFCLTTPAGPLWLEVKSVSLSRSPGLAEFPDTRTARGAKHLRTLAAAVARGERAVMLYLLVRDDCDRIAIAGDIDPAYALALAGARAAGVVTLGLACEITAEGVVATGLVPVL